MTSPNGKPARLVCALLLLVGGALVCRASQDGVPRFRGYPVKNVYRGKNARPVWTRDARGARFGRWAWDVFLVRSRWIARGV